MSSHKKKTTAYLVRGEILVKNSTGMIWILIILSSNSCCFDDFEIKLLAPLDTLKKCTTEIVVKPWDQGRTYMYVTSPKIITINTYPSYLCVEKSF